jgi:hypothetical protein
MCSCNNNGKSSCNRRVRQLNKTKIDLTSLLRSVQEQDKLEQYGAVLSEIDGMISNSATSCPSQAQVDAIKIFTQSELLQRN